MNNTIQLYTDQTKTVKGYPITTPDRVVDESGENIEEKINTINEQMDSITRFIIRPSGDVTGAKDTANFNSILLNNIELVEGIYYVNDLAFLANKSIRGTGIKSCKIKHVGTGTVLWFGNNTQDKPTTIYEGRYNELTNVEIVMNKNSKVGLRVRENVSSNFENILITCDEEITDNDLHIGWFVDGAINCNFRNIDSKIEQGYESMTGANTLALKAVQSNNLIGTAGSGSGASLTSSVFDKCYFHLTRKLAEVVANNIQFNGCVFEGSQDGIELQTPFLNTFNDCYYEAITNSEFIIKGSDTRNLSGNVIIRGGYCQRKDKNGLEKPFVTAQYIEKLKIDGVQINGAISQANIVKLTGQVNSVEIDANPYSLYTSKRNGDKFDLINAFTSNTDGSIIANIPNHGLKDGMFCDLLNFSQLDGKNINFPNWKISLVDENRIKLTNKYRTSFSKVTTGGGTGILRFYGSGVWNNSQLPVNKSIKFNEAKYKEIVFQKTFESAPSGNAGDMVFNGVPASLFPEKTFGFIQKVELFTDKKLDSNAVRNCEFKIKGLFDERTFATFDFSSKGIQYLSSDVMEKIFPGEYIEPRITMAGSSGSKFPQTIVCKITIASLPYDTIVQP